MVTTSLKSMNVLDKILKKLDLVVDLALFFATLIDYMDIQHQILLCIESKKMLMKLGEMTLSLSAEIYSKMQAS